MMLKTILERNYSYMAAGRVWLVPELRLTGLPDGTVGLAEDEIDRVHRAIANEICGSPGPLTADEIEFLCGVAAVTYAEVAEGIGVHRSALTRWRSSTVPVRLITSRAVKRWFWFRLFAAELPENTIPLSAIRDDAMLLRLVHGRALEHRLVSEIHERQAG